MLRAVDRIRTDDLRITRAPLYRLSYNGILPQLGHRPEYSEIASKCKLRRLSVVTASPGYFCTRVT